MRKQITHIKEIHHTFGIDDGTRHQRGAEEGIIAVRDTCGMGQILLVEV